VDSMAAVDSTVAVDPTVVDLTVVEYAVADPTVVVDLTAVVLPTAVVGANSKSILRPPKKRLAAVTASRVPFLASGFYAGN
jgi:hypothetical protein